MVEDNNTADQELITTVNDLRKSSDNIKRATLMLAVIILAFLVALLFYYFVKLEAFENGKNVTVMGLSLNSWGDFVAGFGSIIAVVILIGGLALQMNELAMQRVEIKQTVEEQSRSTAAIRGAGIDENLRAMIQRADTLIEIQPDFKFEVTIYPKTIGIAPADRLFTYEDSSILLDVELKNNQPFTIYMAGITDNPTYQLFSPYYGDLIGYKTNSFTKHWKLSDEIVNKLAQSTVNIELVFFDSLGHTRTRKVRVENAETVFTYPDQLMEDLRIKRNNDIADLERRTYEEIKKADRK
ncbi:MAG: hypothetical protein V7727_19135 [Sneathiella sp.]